MTEQICPYRHKKITKCKIFAECCKESYCCVKCHNDINNHILEPINVSHVICKTCDTLQQASYMCESCDVIFAHYFCAACKIYSQENAFHCNECNACMLGNTYEYKHCKKCNCCILRLQYDQHKCIENRLDNDCTICCTSLKCELKIVILKCGHSLHEHCKDKLLKTHTNCPICKMSIVDMTYEYSQLDDKIKKNPYKNEKTVKIYCNDCIKESNVLYHPLGNKCNRCYSYNTIIL